MCIRDSEDSLARSLVIGSLWERLRDGALAPSEFTEVALRVIPVEEHTVCLLYTSRCV